MNDLKNLSDRIVIVGQEITLTLTAFFQAAYDAFCHISDIYDIQTALGCYRKLSVYVILYDLSQLSTAEVIRPDDG